MSTHARDSKQELKQQQQSSRRSPAPWKLPALQAGVSCKINRETVVAAQPPQQLVVNFGEQPNNSDRCATVNNGANASTPIIALSKLRNYMHSSASPTSSQQSTSHKLTSKPHNNRLIQTSNTKTSSICNAAPSVSSRTTLTQATTSALSGHDFIRVPLGSSLSSAGKSPELRISLVC